MARGSQAGPRIVAGELGGRRLQPPRGSSIRPSAERTREAIFSMLGPIEGLRVLDLFCGTGALGIEALSRGARSLTLVDERIDPARANIDALGLSERARLEQRDALEFLRAARESEARTRFDLVLCDPPYRLADLLGPELDSLLPDVLTKGARVITESAAGGDPLLSLPLLRERRYGSATVRIHGAPR